MRFRWLRRAPNKCPTLQKSWTFNFAVAIPVHQAMRDSVNPGGPKRRLEHAEMNCYSIRTFIKLQSARHTDKAGSARCFRSMNPRKIIGRGLHRCFSPPRSCSRREATARMAVGDWPRKCARFTRTRKSSRRLRHRIIESIWAKPIHCGCMSAASRRLFLVSTVSAVRFSDEGGNACPNYWHFSPYGFCPYDCHYCYLAGTPGVWFSPSVKIFLNLEEILGEVDRTATRLGRPTAFYVGKLQDGLALDPLSGYARTMVPFFARHRYARMVMLTKSADVENLLDLDHASRTILSWTVNAPEVAQLFECSTPNIATRSTPCGDAPRPAILCARWSCRSSRWPIGRRSTGNSWRLCSNPSLCRGSRSAPSAPTHKPSDSWNSSSADRIPYQCCFGDCPNFRPTKMGSLAAMKSDDGRLRFSRSMREEVYRYLIRCIRRHRSDLEIGLCLEDGPMFASLDLTGSMGRCNCVL